jgi:hypothetical protein
MRNLNTEELKLVYGGWIVAPTCGGGSKNGSKQGSKNGSKGSKHASNGSKHGTKGSKCA